MAFFGLFGRSSPPPPLTADQVRTLSHSLRMVDSSVSQSGRMINSPMTIFNLQRLRDQLSGFGQTAAAGEVTAAIRALESVPNGASAPSSNSSGVFRATRALITSTTQGSPTGLPGGSALNTATRQIGGGGAALRYNYELMRNPQGQFLPMAVRPPASLAAAVQAVRSPMPLATAQPGGPPAIGPNVQPAVRPAVILVTPAPTGNDLLVARAVAGNQGALAQINAQAARERLAANEALLARARRLPAAQAQGPPTLAQRVRATEGRPPVTTPSLPGAVGLVVTFAQQLAAAQQEALGGPSGLAPPFVTAGPPSGLTYEQRLRLSILGVSGADYQPYVAPEIQASPYKPGELAPTIFELLTTGMPFEMDLLTAAPSSTDPSTWSRPTWTGYDTSPVAAQQLGLQPAAAGANQAQVRVTWPLELTSEELEELWGVGLSYNGQGFLAWPIEGDLEDGTLVVDISCALVLQT